MGKFNYFALKEKRLEKFSQAEQEDLVFDLINAFALVNTSLDAALLLQDLLTEVEVKNLSKRLRIAKLILDGQTHEEIVMNLHCSFATVTKVRIWLDSAGEGLKKVVQRFPERRKVPLPKRTPGVGYGLPEILSYYTSSVLKTKEKKKMEKFLQNMKTKTASDRDFREEVSSQFRELKSKRKSK